MHLLLRFQQSFGGYVPARITGRQKMELAAFAKRVVSKINLIEYNPIDGGEFQRTTDERVNAFMSELWRNGLVVNLRRSRGKDIDAACGQLANKSVK